MAQDLAAGDRLRILIALMYTYPGPSACSNHMQRLARGLLALGHLPLVVAPQGSKALVEGVDPFDVAYSVFEMPRKPKLLPFYPHWVGTMRPRMFQTVNRELQKAKYDAVITYGETGWVFNPVRKAAQQFGIPVFGYPMECFAPTIAGVLGLSWIDQCWQRRAVYTNCDGIVGISREWERFAKARHLPATVVPSFSKYADDSLPEVISHGPGRFRVVFVGRWIRRELPPTLFAALDMALDRGVDLELVVIGSAGKATSPSQAMEERPSLKALESHPQVRERIRFMGFMTGQPLIDEMGQADAFVILRDDNLETRGLFPTRLPEFLSTGKPLIVSDAGDLALYLKDGVNACVIPPGDRPKELADAICFLATHPEEGGRIGQGGREALAAHFSQRVLAQRIVDLIEAVRRGDYAAR